MTFFFFLFFFGELKYLKDLYQLEQAITVSSSQRGKRVCSWETCTCVKWWVGHIPKYHLPVTDKWKLCSWLTEEYVRLFEVFLLSCAGKCVHVYVIHGLQRVPSHSRRVPALHFPHLQDKIMNLIACCSLVQIMRLLWILFPAYFQSWKECCSARLDPTHSGPTHLHIASVHTHTHTHEQQMTSWL